LAGPVSCFDVIGSSGGSVIIYCTIPKNRGYNGYFCKESAQCVFLESDKTPNSWDHKGRVSVDEISGFLTVIYRDLSLEDTGVYQCGETGERHETLNLNVKSDKCCSGLKTVTCNLGETVTISCSYPEEFKEKSKFISRLNGLDFTEIAHTSDPSTGRFSISEDRMSRVVSMRISDVREGDEGVYYCGVLGDRGAVSYDIFFTKIYLQITGKIHLLKNPSPTTTAATTTPTTISTTTAPISPTTASYDVFNDLLILIICVFVALLLIGGLTWIFYKLRCCRTGGTVHTCSLYNDGDYENDSRQTQKNISMSPVDQNKSPNTNQSQSIYQSLNPNTNQSDSVYQTLNPNTNQSDSVYQSLNPNTNQSDSVYQSLNPNTNQSDSVYQSLNPNTNQSDLVYQTLNPNTNQSDSVYQSLNPNTNQSDSVYQSLNPNTN
ncbi:hypothetical protein AMEX_G24731, partial [Astyanax mexicanus]